MRSSESAVSGLVDLRHRAHQVSKTVKLTGLNAREKVQKRRSVPTGNRGRTGARSHLIERSSICRCGMP